MASVLAPKIQLRIEGNLLAPKVLDFVTKVDVDMARDKADLITVEILNPLLTQVGKQRTSRLPFTDHIAFMPGNVIEVFMSYGDEDPEFIQAGILQKYNPQFPRDGQPTITLKALDASVLLMNGTPNIRATASRPFPGGGDSRSTLAEIAKTILGEYGFDTSRVDTSTKTPAPAPATHKGEGKTDYQLVQGMANTLGWEFFVEWDPDRRRWSAVFRPPEKDTSKKQTFTWGPDFKINGEVGGILHEFDPEFSITNVPSDVEVFYYDEGSRTWERIQWPPKVTKAKKTRKKKKKKFSWAGDDTTIGQDLAQAGSDTGARGLRIQAGGESVEVVPKKGFRSSKEAVAFAQAWFQARMALLIQGVGSTVGYPKMRPSQVHDLQGLGEGLSGDWFIVECRHVFQSGGGSSVYETSFTTNKVIP